MKIIKCEYNWDYGTVDIYLANKTKVSILCEQAEIDLDCNLQVYSKLDELKYEKPLEYAKLVFDGELQKYCDLIADEQKDTSKTLFEQYKIRYPDMSDSQIQSLIREFERYDS